MFVIQKSVADMIMKSRDLSKLQKVKVTDKNGKTRTVYKRTGEQPSEVKQKKPAEEKPVDTKKYSDMLDKVKNGPEENALFVRGKGMLNKKDAIAYLEEKTGKKTSAGSEAKESKVESKKTVGQKMADNEDKAFEESEKNAQKKYGDMSIEELEEFIAEKSKANRYSPEYREAIDANDILQEKKKQQKAEIDFEKKNNASKTEDIKRKNDAENNVNDAIKLSDSEKNTITSTLTSDFMSSLENKEPTTIGNMILNNLYSNGEKDLFNKIRQQEWDYKDQNNKKVNTFNSDYAKEAMYQIYQEFKTSNKQKSTDKIGEKKTESPKREKPQLSPTVLAYRKKQQDAERARYEKDKQLYDFYKNTGLPGGTDFALAQGNVEKEENKQANLKAGNRDDSIFDEGDDVTFWRSGNYIDGKISKVTQDYRGIVSLQIESDGKKYWVETDNIIKHPASAK